MPNAVRNPADLVNLALRNIGYALRVSDLYDGSEAAGQALDIYSQTRDSLLRDGDWQFAQRTVAATLLKSAPANYFDAPWDPATNPQPPWQYEYEYPDDCLKLRQVKRPDGFIFDADPRPTLFAIANDNAYATPARVILSNVPNALLVYAGRVTDPSRWAVDFIDAFAAVLGDRLKRGLKETDLTALDVGMAAGALQSAKHEQG